MTIIHGINKKRECKWLFVVYTTKNRIVGVYRSVQQAQAIAEKWGGKISILNNQPIDKIETRCYNSTIK